jgi:glutamine cyclotransferase
LLTFLFIVCAASLAHAKTLGLNSSFSLGDLGICQGTGITYDSVDDKLWLSDSGTQDRIVEIPLTGGSISTEYSAPARAIEGITMNWSGNIALADVTQDKIYTILKSDGSLAGTLELNQTGVRGPAGITIGSPASMYWISDYDNKRTFRVSSYTGVIYASFSNGAYACEGIAYNADNTKLFLVCRASQRIFEVNQSGGDGRAIDTTTFGCSNPVGVSRNPTTGNLYVVDYTDHNDGGTWKKKLFEITDQGVLVNSFFLNGSNLAPTDVGYDSSTSTLYVSNNGSADSVFEYQTNGTFLDSFSYGPAFTEGLAVASDGLQILDYDEILIHKRNKSTGAYISELAIANTCPMNISGLTIDATYYWALNYVSKTAFKIDQTGAVQSSFSTAWGASPNHQPEDIYYDSGTGYLYIVDSNRDRLYESNTSGALQASYDLSAHGIGYPTGITMKNGEDNIYITDIEDDRVYYMSLITGGGAMGGGPLGGGGSAALSMSGGYRQGFDGGTLYGYNTLGPGSAEVAEMDGNNVAEIIEGILAAGISPPDGAVKMYTEVDIPVAGAKLSFDYMMGEFDETNYFAALFEGVELLRLNIEDKEDYFQTVEIDISQFGGRPGELAFFLAGQTDDLYPDRIWIDDIQITGIPESPSILLLLSGSVVFLTVTAIRGKRRLYAHYPTHLN